MESVLGIELSTTTIIIGLFAAMVGFACFVLMLIKKERANWVIGVMLFASSLGIPVEYNGKVITGIFFKLQLYRSELFLLCGMALACHVLVHIRETRGRFVSLQGSIIVVMGFYAALLRFIHSGAADGSESVLYAFFTLIPLLWALPLLIHDFSDVWRLLRTFAVVNAIWIGGVAAQIAINPSVVVIGREQRFIGLLGNPQHTGTLMAVFVALSLYLFLNDPLKRYKLIYLTLFGINTGFRAWAWSRTGLVMAVLAITGVLYARVGKAILWLPAVAIFVAISLKLLEMAGLSIGFERLASTNNTRASAWSNLWHNGLDSPIVGKGVEGAGDSENGYLYGFAAYGIGMVMLIMILMLGTAYTSFKLWARRKYLPIEYRSLSDFLIGYFALYFGGSFFEGYMMARVASHLLFFLVFTGIASQFIQMTNRALAAEPGLDDEYDSDQAYKYEVGYYNDSYPAL